MRKWFSSVGVRVVAISEFDGLQLAVHVYLDLVAKVFIGSLGSRSGSVLRLGRLRLGTHKRNRGVPTFAMVTSCFC